MMTIVIPAYNEQQSIGATLASLLAHPELAGCKVLVIDDGSEDSTADVAAAAGVEVLRNSRNLGYGAALKRGIRAARTELIAWYDADGQHDPEELAQMQRTLQDRRVDAVIGQRTLGGYQDPWRRPGKALLRWVTGLAAGRHLPDPNCGLRVCKRAVALRYLHLLPNGFSASTTFTLTLLQRQYDVLFYDLSARARAGGQSSARQWKDGLAALHTILRVTVLFSALRTFSWAALFFFVPGMVYGLYIALSSGRGFPTFALLLAMLGVQLFFLGILCDQISALRLERWEAESDE